MDFLDFSQVSDPKTAYQTWLRERSQILFDFKERLFDAALVKISAQQFIWYLAIHHIVTDGWSTSIIFDRIKALYKQSLEGSLEQAVDYPAYQDFIHYRQTYRTPSGNRGTDTESGSQGHRSLQKRAKAGI